MPFRLPDLPYKFDALEPAIDTRTMEIHHGKHHAAYVNKLNEAIAKHPELGDKTVEELLAGISDIPEDIRTAVRNHGGGHANHSLFWAIMKPNGSGEPSGALAKAISSTFGSFANFQEKIVANGMGQFGSGWTWLVVKADKTLAAYATPNQDSPLMTGDIPILGIDVWEHAYYLKYQNKRDEYLKNWWSVVNWKQVARLFDHAVNQ